MLQKINEKIDKTIIILQTKTLFLHVWDMFPMKIKLQKCHKHDSNSYLGMKETSKNHTKPSNKQNNNSIANQNKLFSSMCDIFSPSTKVPKGVKSV